MMSEIQKVLNETVLLTQGEFVFVTPVCDFFGIQRRHQIDQLKNDPICQSDMQKIACESVFGDKRKRLVLSRKGFIRWIQLISAALVRPNLRQLFIKYQVAVFDYLYRGTEAKNIQLEDIRNFALNINNALSIKTHIMEYVGEQKQHRDLCLASTPTDWLQMRERLITSKSIPEKAQKLIAIDTLPDSVDELKRLKKNLQTNIIKNQNRIRFQSPNYKSEDNPMPDGYRREHLKLKVKQQEAKVTAINEKLIRIEKMEG